MVCIPSQPSPERCSGHQESKEYPDVSGRVGWVGQIRVHKIEHYTMLGITSHQNSAITTMPRAMASA